jgi:hypothetical protein
VIGLFLFAIAFEAQVVMSDFDSERKYPISNLDLSVALVFVAQGIAVLCLAVKRWKGR